jgi:hypothetical protein
MVKKRKTKINEHKRTFYVNNHINVQLNMLKNLYMYILHK